MPGHPVAAASLPKAVRCCETDRRARELPALYRGELFLMRQQALPVRLGLAHLQHKDFSDLYEKMSGKGASASKAHL